MKDSIKNLILFSVSIILFVIGGYHENVYLTNAGYSVMFVFSYHLMKELKEQKEATETYKQSAKRLRQMYEELQLGAKK